MMPASAAGRRRAVFLDREGTLLNNQHGYVIAESDVEFLPCALSAARTLADTDFAIVIVTNQSPVSRNMITLGDALALNSHIAGLITTAGGRVDATYLCPHQDDDSCECRKPRPGMLLRAEADLALDLSKSVVIGDSLRDLELALAVEASAILVLTGNGEHARRSLDRRPDLMPFVTTCTDVGRAAHLVAST